jgi:hypothetical protein
MRFAGFAGGAIRLYGMAVLLLAGMPTDTASAQGPGGIPVPQSSQDWSGPLGIAAKKPVYAGGCKACPFGILGVITREALSHYGYDVHVCYTCATALAAKDMSFKETKQQDLSDPFNQTRAYIESTPPAVPDISTGSEVLMTHLLREGSEPNSGGTPGAPAVPLKNNLRLIANLITPTWYVVLVRRSLGITSLAQLKNRRGIWIYGGDGGPVLKYYGLTREVLQKNGGGFINGSGRERRASADVWIGDYVSLTHTLENRMWGEITQLNDLMVLPMEDALLDQLVATGDYVRTVLPLESFRGVDRPIPTVSRRPGIFIYVRDEAPDDFAYTLAKALYEHRELFREQITVLYYDPETVVKSVLPLHPGAAKFYREVGFIK